MNTGQTVKKALAAALLVAISAMGTTASAQDVAGGDRVVDDSMMDELGTRIQEGVEEAEDEREVQEIDAERDIDLADYEDERRDMTPEELDQLRRQMEQQNARLIEQFRQLIADAPQDPDRPEWMFHKAERVWELRNMEYIRSRNEYNACMDAVYEGTLEEDACPEPDPDYAESQVIYEQILQQYPNYDRLDEVIFRLGIGLLEADQGAQAIQYLNRLVNEYPNSQYVPDAYLQMGDYFFEEHQTFAAKNNYEEVLEFSDYRNFDYALYQLGWTHYNMEDEDRASADYFKRVVEREQDAAEWGLLANRAINDLMLPLSQIPGGWKEAREYFIEIRDIEFAYGQMQTMAMHLEAQGREDDAIAVYDWLLDEQPNHEDVPDWMDAIVRSLRDLDFDAYEARVVEYVDYLHPDHTWYRQNEENEAATQVADRFVERNLARLGSHYHVLGQEEGTVAYFEQAAQYYQQFIDRFPRHHLSFDMTYYLGDIYLHHMREHAQAAEQYQHVVNLYVEDNVPEGVDEEQLSALVRDAAYNIVVAYNYLVRENHPESVLVAMAERAGDDPELVDDGLDGVVGDDGEIEVQEREPLLEWEERFVEASDQFSDMYPNDDITPTVDYVAAEVYRDRGHFDSCIPRYESIIENAPEHTYASFAGNSLLEANYRLENWDDVERWARHLIEHEIFDVTPEESLISAIAFAINNRAIDYMDAQEHVQGAEELLRLAEEFPDNELASGALFNAAVVYDEGDEVTRAADIFQRVVDDYADSPEAPRALVELGLIYQARTDFARAADYFVRLAEEEYRDYRDYRMAGLSDDEEPDFEPINAYDAVFNAASLREAMEEWDDAIATYELYLEYFDDEIDDQQEIEYHLAWLEQERGDLAASRDRLNAYLEKWGDEVPLYERVETYTELGLIAEKLEVDNVREVAEEYFTRALELWQDEDLWNEEFGEEGEATRRAMRDSAAQARFHQAEYIFREFQDVELNWPPEELTESATKKAEIQQEAEQMYIEIIQMQSRKWVAAAAYRIGQSYDDFAQELLDMPIPDDVPEDMHWEYEMAVDDFVFPLVEQSLVAFENAWSLAIEHQAYNEWSALSAIEISRLEEAMFPITEQDGVDPEHYRVDFFAPAPVTDFAVVRERSGERYERLRPEEPDPTLEPGHPHYDPRIDRDSPEFDPVYKRELLGPDEDELEGEPEPHAGRR